MRRMLYAVTALVGALLIAAFSLTACAQETQDQATFIKASVVYVVDGDTLVVQRDDGQGPEKVRLIGIDCPESVASREYLLSAGKENTLQGKAASERTSELCPKGATVWLQLGADPLDKYGRTLAYVWMEKPDDAKDLAEIRSKMLNAILLDEGWAQPMTIKPNTEYKGVFEKIAKR